MHVKVGFKNDGSLTAVQDTVVADAGVSGTSGFAVASDMRLSPFFTTKCQNLKTDCQSVFTNTGRMYTSGQTFPFNWDGLTITEQKPTMLDISPVNTIAVETRSGNAAYGASGISHAIATTQLIVCAVANAIGKWIAPPLTPDKVLKSLGKV